MMLYVNHPPTVRVTRHHHRPYVGDNTALNSWDDATECKHPVFGRLREASMAAVSKIGACSVDGDDRPSKSIKIKSVSIV